MAIKAVIADDSVIFRRVMKEALGRTPDVILAGTAPDGEAAVQMVKAHQADVVFLDIFMPRMDGVQAMARIRAESPRTQIVMVSGVAGRDAAVVVSALKSGALDFISKPTGFDPRKNAEELLAEVERVLAAVRARISPGAQRSAEHGRAPARVSTTTSPGPFSLVVIGSSTGGPEALAEVIPRLPANFPAPVLIVQHMPPVFTAALAGILQKQSALKVREALDGDKLEPGVALIAPGGSHMVVRKTATGNIIGLTNDPPENSCRPAVDTLFRSIMESWRGGGWVLSVILTGMGVDGRAGVGELKKRNCYSIVQSRETSLIYGMPAAVEEAGLADSVVHLPAIADEIMRLLRNGGVK